MTRARKLTLSVKEFSHLVSESLDMLDTAPLSQSLLSDTTTVASQSPPKHRTRPSFQRIFSRPTPDPHQDLRESPEDRVESPRKAIPWPFSRSPRKHRPRVDEDSSVDVKDPVSPYSLTSPAAGSTSSLGSLVPAHERLFQVSHQDLDGPSRQCDLFTTATSSPGAVASTEPPARPEHDAAVTLDATFGNESTASVLAGPPSAVSDQSRPSLQGTDASHSTAGSTYESSDEDPTPRASAFGPRAAFPLTRSDPAFLQRGRAHHLSLVVPSRNLSILALRPVVGAAPHAPSETESSTSLCSTSSMASPISRSSSPTILTSSPCVPPSTPPTRCVTLGLPCATLSSKESVPSLSPRQRKRAMSRSMTPPPLSRPPPTGPLPAVPSTVPPVPPLPPLLHKISMNAAPHSAMALPPRPTGAQTNPTLALPSPSQGGLRLPSRLSWVNGVRAVLPSPPASPTKSLKSLASKVPLSPSKAETNRPHELKRPTSIGVIEAADNVQVRRTKSILLLGSKSKSAASLRTKRVQIHADVNVDAGETRKPRRKSSAATVCFESGQLLTPMPSAELLVPRERRHSAPLLSSMESNVPGDWTLSLPFCTDVPGNKISPLSTPKLGPELGLEEVRGEDWTLCMPLKVRVDTPTIASTTERESECTLADTTEAQAAVQLPTPSPSPTRSTLPLDPEERVSVERPASPASLGPHVGGLDLTGGRGKRASGWHVYGWFDAVRADEWPAASVRPRGKRHVTRPSEASARHPSQDSVSTAETMFYSARSSLLVH